MPPGIFRPPPLSPSASSSTGQRTVRTRTNGQWGIAYGEPMTGNQSRISEMINPDGSVTVRKRVVNPDGSRSIVQEEYSSLDRRILGTMGGVNFTDEYEDPIPELGRSSSESDSSIATVKTTPSRAANLSSDQSSDTSAFSPLRKAGAMGEGAHGRGFQVMGGRRVFERHIDVSTDEEISQPTSGHHSDSSGLQPPTIRRTNVPVQSDGSESSESSDSSQEDVARRSTNVKQLYRPKNPVPFDYARGGPPKPAMSVNTWAADDPDVSAISGDSMGYPVLDTSTLLYDEHSSRSDDETVWSLLQEDSDMPSGSKNPGKSPLPNRRMPNLKGSSDSFPGGRTNQADSTSNSSSDTSQQETGESQSSSNASSMRGVHTDQTSSDSSTQQHIVVSQYSSSRTRPKPKVRNFTDTGTTKPSVNQKQRELRDKGALFDIRSDSFDSSETSPIPSNEEIVFTVRKKFPDDKIGIFVGARQLPVGPRLVVTKVSPNGKFAESPIEQGDIVVSVNGVNFLQRPNAKEALDIVRRATDRITFVVLKSRNPAMDASMDELPLPSLPYHNVQETIHADRSKTVTREIGNTDGSHTVVEEFFDSNGRKQKQTTRRRWLMFDGSTRDISVVSLDIKGAVTIQVKKPSQSHIVGLGLQIKQTHRGQNAMVVSQVFPSGLFARTPLSVDDIILSINNVDFSENPDLSKASVMLAKAEGNIMISASKSLAWVQNKRNRLSQTRQLVETFTIPPPKSTSFEFDDASYGGSMLGYKSAKKLTLQKLSASERHGIAIKSQPTHWGILLVATAISQNSRLASAGLKEGDVILTINGVDFSKEPDANKAMSLIRNNTDTDIELEYQRMHEILDTVDEEVGEVQTSETFKPDGTKCIRTETRNPDGSIFVKIEEITPDNPVDVTIEDPQGSITGPSDMSDITGWDVLSTHNSFREASLETQEKPLQTRGAVLAPMVVTVKKNRPSQEVGVSLGTMGGVLYVKKISTMGLLVGKPILPGDTVLAINGVDFRRNPSVRDAVAVMAKSSATISFRILKTSLVGDVASSHGAKRFRFKDRWCCKKANERVEHSANRTNGSGRIGEKSKPPHGRVPFYL